MLSVKSFERKLDLCDASVSILTLGTVGKPWQQKGADLIFSTPVALRWWSHLRCHCRKWLQWALKSFIVLDSLAMVRQPCVVKEIWCRKAAVEDNTSIQAEGNSSADGKRGMRWNVMTAIWLLSWTRKKKKNNTFVQLWTELYVIEVQNWSQLWGTWSFLFTVCVTLPSPVPQWCLLSNHWPTSWANSFQFHLDGCSPVQSPALFKYSETTETSNAGAAV